MSLPKPNASFKIPSIYDDVELDCRLHYPRKTEANLKVFGRGFAILAHPYGPLGGCCDDPVVALIGGFLLLHGFVLITFNFRGASTSAGRTSWSGKPELSDYVSVYGFALQYIHALACFEDGFDACRTKTPILVLGGYSYGSMIASHLPPMATVVDVFNSASPDSAQSEIKRRADDLCDDARVYFDTHSVPSTLPVSASPAGRGRKSRPGVVMGGYDSDVTSRRVSRENSRKSIDAEKIRQSLDRVRCKVSSRRRSSPPSNITTAHGSISAATNSMNTPAVAYLIVSPILSIVAAFTTMFLPLKFTPKGRQVTHPPQQQFHELTSHPCCCIYGNKDGFTSARRLRRWTEELKSTPGSHFTAIETDAGHFWHEARDVAQLKLGLAEFLEQLSVQCEAEMIRDDGRSQ